MWRTHRHNAATGLDGGHQGVKSELSTFWFVNLVPLGFASQELCRLLCIRASVRTCPYTSYRELYIIIKVYILHHPWSRFTLTIKLCFYFVPPANGRWHIYWWRLVSVSGLKLRGNGRSNTNPLMQKDLLMTIASSAQRSYVMLGKGDTTISHSVFWIQDFITQIKVGALMLEMERWFEQRLVYHYGTICVYASHATSRTWTSNLGETTQCAWESPRISRKALVDAECGAYPFLHTLTHRTQS